MPSDPSSALPLQYLELHLPGQSRIFPIEPDQICRIGRAAHNAIVLESPHVSRNHALVDCPGGLHCVFTDLGSSNGSSINGVRVSTPQVLHDGDLIALGNFRLHFRQPLQGGACDSQSVSRTVRRVIDSEITILVVDIRGYTQLSAALGPRRISEVVGCFIRECGALLLAQGAWSQKYIGDAVMAVWLHDPAAPDSAVVHKALRSLYGIHQFAATLQQRFQLEAPVRIGGGINTGMASIGNLGSLAEADHTALGDPVNKAFRLESATKDAGCEILIGPATLEHLSPDPPGPPFQHQQLALKGYGHPQDCYGLSFAALETLLQSD
ncbi:MAG: adenylate/guanylate cyclase domain-containing protein [Acidobacteria bacterium]|nr:adenylate/guanylate cyclase domain-containing protein [Acidobacteriota bacterium]